MNKLVYIFILCILSLCVPAQENSIILEIESGDQGVLISRTTTTAIQNPVDGLLMYDTVEHAFKYYDGTMWKTFNVVEPHSFYYLDLDGDTYGDSLTAVYAPEAPNSAYVSNDLDCNDGDNNINPGITEICDNIDNNCNGQIDEGNVCVECMHNQTEQMACGSDVGACAQGIKTRTCQFGIWGPWGPCENEVGPSPEICDGIDNDCDNLVDNNATDCPPGAPFCLGNGNCVECLLDSNCPEGMICVGNACQEM